MHFSYLVQNCRMNRQRKTEQSMKTETKSKTGHKNATAQLADINRQIEALNQQRVALADPLKQRYGEMRGELVALETEIRSLDSAWRPTSLRPKVDDRIREVITAHGKPMSTDDIIKELTGTFTSWKIKNVLKKRSTGAKAVLTLADGKYSVKA
jgi:hypothetical protein